MINTCMNKWSKRCRGNSQEIGLAHVPHSTLFCWGISGVLYCRPNNATVTVQYLAAGKIITINRLTYNENHKDRDMLIIFSEISYNNDYIAMLTAETQTIMPITQTLERNVSRLQQPCKQCMRLYTSAQFNTVHV